ncbi:endothelin-converting enzyme homolog [Lingula anatina]|uniref:Endothelin-converting enzyme homolog n=1 Tax=Lingula anatina TaxID=7574 RepID=A0A1S3HJB8_LINAN|nr:endothelin-converting enzyme homolog [Lingula anatina]|eukprot:XP_013386225.1 endothelin-converting enzyme homolog [Lingula anatina]
MAFGSKAELVIEEYNANPRKWRRQRKHFIFALCLAGVVILGLIVILSLEVAGIARIGGAVNERINEGGNTDARVGTTPSPDTLSQTCLTPECIRAANVLVSGLDPSVDPCQDFWQFSCGGWLKKNPIPADQRYWGIDSTMGETIKSTLKTMLETPIMRDGELSSERKFKQFYQSCMDTEAIDKLGKEPAEKMIENLGGWAPLGDWNATLWDFSTALITAQYTFDRSVLFRFYITADDRNSTRNIIQIDQGGLTTDRSYYFENETTSTFYIAYKEFMVRIAALMGADENATEQFVQDIITFEKSLANITIATDAPERIDPDLLYNKLTLGELKELSPYVDWVSFFAHNYDDITNATEVIITNRRYFGNLSELIDNTEPKVLNSYLVWVVMRGYLHLLSSDFRGAMEDYQKARRGTTKTQDRWKTCQSAVNSQFGLALGGLFVEEYFSPESKTEAEDLIARVKDVFVGRLDSIYWMDEQTKEAAKEKAYSMKYKIGYPPMAINTTALDDKYKGVNISCADCYLQNVLARIPNDYKESAERLKKPVDKNRWYMNPQVVNAYYSSTSNQMVFPAGIMQWPFFDKNQPRFMNYGMIGAVVGHELTHGFDDSGAKYNLDGNLEMWWQSEAWSGFEESTKCVSDYYSTYSVKNMTVNGKLTLGENIADIGGLLQTYYAYKNWETENGPERTLPGLNRTTHEAFFISFAQSWCGEYRPKYLKTLIRTDSHAPVSVRVLGTVSQMKEFAEAFKCPKGSPMNPEERCSVW